MNFFEHQASARRQSRWMVWAFALSVLATVLGVTAVMAVGVAFGRAEHMTLADAVLPRLPMLLLIAASIAAVIGTATLYKISQLKAGGGAVAVAQGGTLVPPEARDPRLRRLRNVVEEIAIASGVPPPQVFVLEREAGINAFAAGFSPADAAITVTRGALEKLSRDELQGVVAHEFSHILNGDMRLNIRLMGMVFGLLVIHLIGREVLAQTAHGEKRGGTLTLLGFGLLILGWLGMLCARLIKARIAQQREYLADASAVQFTRQTDGLAGALKKLAGLDAGSRLQHSNGEEVSHMLFGQGLAQAPLFATHPPVLERIRRLQPHFSPSELQHAAAVWNHPGFLEPLEELSAGFATSAPELAPALSPASVVAQVAHPGGDDYRQAEWIAAELPAELRTLAEDPSSAPSLLLALLLSESAARDPALLQERQSQIASSVGEPVAAAVLALQDPVARLARSLRLPLASLAFASLRRLPELQLRLLQSLITRLTLADGQVQPFEFALGHLLRVQLDDWFAPATARPTPSLKLYTCTQPIAQLLAALAAAGTSDAQTAALAFQKGWASLYGGLTPSPSVVQSAAALHAALGTLDGLVPFAKQALIEAMVLVLAFDGRTTVGEAELLRVVCASLHCPLPAALGDVARVG